MRKISIFLLALLLLTGCCKSDVPRIDEYVWELTSVQSKAQNGAVVAYGERGMGTAENAVYVGMVCTAQSGVLTLADISNGKTYTGSYTLLAVDSRTAHYEITLEGKSGLAVVAMTTYHDGSQDPTLIIDLKEYVINCFAK